MTQPHTRLYPTLSQTFFKGSITGPINYRADQRDLRFISYQPNPPRRLLQGFGQRRCDVGTCASVQSVLCQVSFPSGADVISLQSCARWQPYGT